MNVSAVLRTVRQETENALRALAAHRRTLTDPKERLLLRAIRRKGYCVVPNFYTAERCAELRREVDRLLQTYREKVQTDAKGSDHRLFGADRVSPLIKSFYDDPLIARIMEAHEKTDYLTGLTLAARLDFVTGNQGSGDGWHRDWSVREQIKAIVYLSDVTEKNGPFEYIEGSHHPLTIINDLVQNSFSFNQNRFTHTEIEALLARGNRTTKRILFPGKAGTLILVNTRGLHRGSPIQEGVRYALTNYVWSRMPIPKHVAELALQGEIHP